MTDSDARAKKANAARRRELRAWKEENGVSADTKVFVMDAPAKNRQGDEAVREYLEGLGWHYNEAVEPPESLLFDLRFQRLRRRSSRDRVKDTEGQGESWHASGAAGGDPLAPFQLTNHYTHSGVITTKTGLVRTLQDVRFMGDADPDEFAPRAYCINNADEMAVFYDDYRRVAAECALFGIVERATAAETVVNRALLDACEAICTRQLAATPDLDDEDPKASGGLIVTPVKAVEWEVLRAAQELTAAQRGDFSHGWRGIISDQEIQLPETPAKPDIEVNVTAELNADSSNVTGKLAEQMRTKAAKARSATRERDRAVVVQACKQLVSIDPERLAKLRRCLANLQNVGGRQHTLHAGVQTRANDAVRKDGDVEISRQPNCYQGLWIVKPAKLSRGRGIRVFNTLSDLLAYVGPSKGVKTRRAIQIGGWMVMKYIERPLTIGRRKWDMRQWVLVASWNPLVVFMNKECYARFAVEEYDETLTDPTKEALLGDAPNGHEDGDRSDGDDGNSSDSSDDDSDDDAYKRKKAKQKAANISARGGFVHLVNNSVSKYSDNFTRTFTAENGTVVSGHMLNNADLSEYLRWHSGGEKDVYAHTVKPAMQRIAKAVLNCVVAQGQPKQRENSFEVFGFDFFIDEQYNPWLIEINSSPAVDYSTPVTEVYCSEGLVDSVKVGVDWKAWWLKARAGVTDGETSSDDEDAIASSRDGDQSQTASVNTGDETKPERSSLNWDDQPDVGVWECLMSREELLADAVDTDPNRGEKVPKLELAGRSVKALRNESKRRKAEAKKEEERLRARAQRAVEAKAAQEAAVEKFRFERKVQQIEEERMLQKFQQGKVIETTADDEGCVSPTHNQLLEQGSQDLPQCTETTSGPCGTPQKLEQPCLEINSPPKKNRGGGRGVHEQNRIPMRPYAEKFARAHFRFEPSHCYRLDEESVATAATKSLAREQCERPPMLAVSRSQESALVALAGHGRQEQQAAVKLHQVESLHRPPSHRHGLPPTDPDLSSRLLNRVAHLDSTQTRPAAVRHAGMTVSAARHATGATRWKWHRGEQTLADGRSANKAPMQVVTNPTSPCQIQRARTAGSSTVGATSEFMRFMRDRDRLAINMRADANGRLERRRRSDIGSA